MSIVYVEIDELAKRGALQRILDDAHFQNVDRLREFLTYIVEEEISGRGGEIRGKTIAQDVYGIDPGQRGDPENAVRVDARRLRQLLEVYYETAGKKDPVQLCIDPGGYVPRYEATEASADSSALSWGPKTILPIAAFVTGVLIGGGLSQLLWPGQEPNGTPLVSDSRSGEPENLRRAAILEKSPAALQAVNLAEQARAMIFPIFDQRRQFLMAKFFEEVILLDPDYFGGYAGAAQVGATLALIAPTEIARQQNLDYAGQMSAQAIRLAPGDAWTQSALAWERFAARDFDSALRISKRAADISPESGHVLEFRAAILLFSGEFSEALALADREGFKGASNQRFANRNVAGGASFHLGRYKSALENFEAAASFGDPLSAMSIAYKIAAMNALGRSDEARAELEELKTSWPDARVDQMLLKIHRNPEHALAVLTPLKALGWSPGGTDNSE